MNPVAVLVAVPPAGLLLADAATGSGLDVVQLITGLGFPTAFAVAWIVGWVVSGRELERVVARHQAEMQRIIADRDEERAERLRMQAAMSDKAIPALTRQTLVLEAVLPLLEERVRIRAARDPDPEGV